MSLAQPVGRYAGYGRKMTRLRELRAALERRDQSFRLEWGASGKYFCLRWLGVSGVHAACVHACMFCFMHTARTLVCVPLGSGGLWFPPILGIYRTLNHGPFSLLATRPAAHGARRPPSQLEGKPVVPRSCEAAPRGASSAGSLPRGQVCLVHPYGDMHGGAGGKPPAP